ncbi:MAG: hypothetical protein ACR2OB_04625 [Solirubrobacteraceae bacterium]
MRSGRVGPRGARGSRSRFGVRLAIVAVCALAVRLLYILVIARAPVGVGGDAGFYHSAANLLASGRFYYRGIFGHAYVTAEHPPLYPLLLSVVSLTGAKTLLAHRVAGCIVGAASVGLIGELGRRLNGRSGIRAGNSPNSPAVRPDDGSGLSAFRPDDGSRPSAARPGDGSRSSATRPGERAGLIAAGVAAVYPPFVTADGLVMSEPLFVFMVVVALLIACRLIVAPNVALAGILGVLVGLAALTRPEGLLLLVLLGWPAGWMPARGRALRLIAMTVATAVVLTPWVVRNVVVFHRVTLATDANTVLAGANCHDTYYGRDVGWWSLDCLGRGRTRGQLLVGDASPAAGLRYARDHLARLSVVVVARVLRTFDLLAPLRQGNREPRRRWVDVLGLVFYFPLLLLAGLGFARNWRERRSAITPAPGRTRSPALVALILAPVWSAVIVSVLGWGIGRFRVGADVSLIVLATLALAPPRLRRARARSESPGHGAEADRP